MKRPPVVLWATIAAALLVGAEARAQSSLNVYQHGKNAFDRGDYPVAAKYLFAYRRLEQGKLEAALGARIDDAISYCDEQIANAIRIQQDLEKYGHITEVVIDASGKADGMPVKRTRPYQKPPARQRPKPGLPATAAAASPQTGPPPRRLTGPMATLAPWGGPVPADRQRIERSEQEMAAMRRELEMRQQRYEALSEKYRALLSHYRELRRQQE